MPNKPPVYPPPVRLTLPLHSACQHPIRPNLHILQQTPLALTLSIRPLPNALTHHIPHLTLQPLPLHNSPGSPLYQPQRRPNNPLDPVLRVRDIRFERDCCVPQAFGQGVHIVCHFVALRVGRVGGRG